MCVDYRDVNAQSKKNFFRLSRIDQVWPTLSRKRFFESLDLLMGFHQVEVVLLDKAKTAFLTQCNLYVSKVMPFGRCNASTTVLRFIKKVLGPLISLGVFFNIDDMLI